MTIAATRKARRIAANIAELLELLRKAISDSISPVTKKTLENHAGPMLLFSGLFPLLHSGSAPMWK